MNNVNLKVTGGIGLNPNVIIDNNPVKLKKNKYGSLDGNYQTENSEIELKVCRYLELSSKLWLLMSMVFFIISIFGIFNPPYDKKCIQIDYLCKIKLKETNDIKIKINTQNAGDKAIEVESECKIEEITNTFQIDKVVKKRLVIVRIIEVALWVALVGVIIFLLAKKNG